MVWPCEHEEVAPSDSVPIEDERSGSVGKRIVKSN